MKRDWDVIREILQKVEELEHDKVLVLGDFEKERWGIVSYNAYLMSDAGLINMKCIKSYADAIKSFSITGLTWEGHEFFASIRSESIWKKTKSKIIGKGGSMTFDIIKTVAIELFKSSIGT
jgi:hypothetical protein